MHTGLTSLTGLMNLCINNIKIFIRRIKIFLFSFFLKRIEGLNKLKKIYIKMSVIPPPLPPVKVEKGKNKKEYFYFFSTL